MEVTAQGVAGLLQEAARVLGVRVRPQVGDELVAAEAALARGGEEGEERERLALLRGSAHGHAVGCYRSEEHTSELQSQSNLVCRLLLEKKKRNYTNMSMTCVMTPPTASARSSSTASTSHAPPHA